MTAPAYCFDANIIIDLNRHSPRDVWEVTWSAVEALIEDGRAVMPRDVYRELERWDDACAPWAKSVANFIVETTSEELSVVAELSAQYPDWVSGQQNAADPFVIAAAHCRSLSIVTHETAKGAGYTQANMKIPNAAAGYGIECLRFVDVARREGWIFR